MKTRMSKTLAAVARASTFKTKKWRDSIKTVPPFFRFLPVCSYLCLFFSVPPCVGTNRISLRLLKHCRVFCLYCAALYCSYSVLLVKNQQIIRQNQASAENFTLIILPCLNISHSSSLNPLSISTPKTWSKPTAPWLHVSILTNSLQPPPSSKSRQ